MATWARREGRAAVRGPTGAAVEGASAAGADSGIRPAPADPAPSGPAPTGPTASGRARPSSTKPGRRTPATRRAVPGRAGRSGATAGTPVPSSGSPGPRRSGRDGRPFGGPPAGPPRRGPYPPPPVRRSPERTLDARHQGPGWACRVDDGQNRAVPAPRTVALLGSTGSIGTQAVDVVERNPDRFSGSPLAASGARPGLLAEQAARLRVGAVAIADPAAEPAVASALRDAGAGQVRLLVGPDAATELAARGGGRRAQRRSPAPSACGPPSPRWPPAARSRSPTRSR